MKRIFILSLLLVFTGTAGTPINVAGVYPSLTMYNSEGECGTGAVVPWAGRLWVVTYAPHGPMGSTDKLYEITPDLKQVIRPESIGGTPANRMIHKESNQLSIGPYLIDQNRKVRAIPYTKMPGRPTGTARHLTDPANKIYVATMEEGLYTVDVNDLSVIEHVKDGNGQKAVGAGVRSTLPGYHGKGLYTSQGMLVYANNGERSKEARIDPTIESGGLGYWQGEGDWQLIRRNQFTEVTGPGGIYGSTSKDDPIWAMGWDTRSLILMLLEKGQWHAYRLPKASHSYDGAHGWNTEWPRIREIGEEHLLATMHGTFWQFPKTFTKANSAGIAPRSNYLKVIGDFTKWNDKLVIGCDDSAQKEFLNHRPFKSTKGAPVQSNSNLWFVEPEILDQLGPAIGRGSVWLREDVTANNISDPYLFSGYDHRLISIHHNSATPVTITLEVDKEGNDTWTPLRKMVVDKSAFHVFSNQESGAWIRARAETDAKNLTIHFHYRNQDARTTSNSALFSPIAKVGEAPTTTGLIRSNRKVLSMLSDNKYFELDANLNLTPKNNATEASKLRKAAQPSAISIKIDAASAIVTEDGRTYRIPKNDAYRNPRPQADKPSKTVTLKDVIDRSLAKGATATSSNHFKSYEANQAVDGKLTENSRWIGAGATPKVLEIDLQSPKTFKQIVIANGLNQTEQPVSNLKIEFHMEGNWKPVPGGSINKNTSNTFAIDLTAPITTQKLRLTSNDSTYVRVYEVALFADVHKFADSATFDVSIPRICREVATERDLFNFDGTFYELPARNAQGFAKIRPVSTHNLAIHDYASHFGLLFLTGLTDRTNDRVFASADKKAAVWTGVIDDLWKLGKPRAQGGTWKNSEVKADAPSDPYLMTGYDKKSVELSASADTTITIEVDVDGTGLWVPYKSFAVSKNKSITHQFPTGFSAYWVRTTSSTNTTATAWFTYK